MKVEIEETAVNNHSVGRISTRPIVKYKKKQRDGQSERDYPVLSIRIYNKKD
jgi:hypothetical protein